MRVTLVLPPLTQLNTPYPAPAYLARTLRAAGHEVSVRDLGLELVLRLYSRAGLAAVFDAVEALAEDHDLPEPAWRALALRRQHEACIDGVIRFLQGRDRGLAPRIVGSSWLPRGPRLDALAAADGLDGFGPQAVDDAARRLATVYLEDLADLVTSTLDEGFALARYQHHLAAGPAGYDALHARLGETTLLDGWLDALADSLVPDAPGGAAPDLVGLSAPFPGNLYGALRIGRRLRRRGVPVLLGGGYPNTELRELAEPRLWENVDAVCLDDGEGPLLAWLDHAAGGPDRRHRTITAAGRLDHPHDDVPAGFAPDYADLPLDRYLQLVDSVNPAHRLWSDGRWNKLTVAHGCYWKRCSFCDIQLDYIARYAPTRAVDLADAMDELVATTGQSGFHLVDEAAPPRVVRDLALELLRRGSSVSFWGNIRFDRAWTPDLARVCAAAGMVAVTGGLEVASDRLLAKMEKGVTLADVVRATWGFGRAGVLVHAYLMYGFPTETDQESVDAMEVVRQLFAEGLLESAFWHRFVLTRHSGMARDPAAYGVVVPPTAGTFARNDLPHEDPTGGDHDRFDAPLVAALGAWMRGEALERPVTTWFAGGVPSPTVAPDLVRTLRAAAEAEPVPAAGRLVWLGGDVLADGDALALHHADGVEIIRGRRAALDWLAEVIEAARPNQPALRADDALGAFPGDLERFTGWPRARRAGLAVV